jgi:hypothetical protein
MSRETLKYTGWIVFLLLVAIQFYQPDRTNPSSDPAAAFEAIAKPNPQLIAIVQRACYDCHSHNTVWPWYSRIAPASWLIADDVVEARAHLNFSQWNLLSPEMSRAKLRAACQEATKGDMPLWYYQLMHPKAKLSQDDIKLLCDASSHMP